ELVGRKAVEQGGDDGIDANGFAGAGAAGDEQVRHLREIRDDRVAVNVFAERQRDASPGAAPFLGFEQITNDHLRLNEVGNFKADGAFAGNGREDVDALGFERGGDVVVQGGDFFEF